MEEILVADLAGERPVADPVDRRLGLVGVDRDHRDGRVLAGGKNIGIAGEADEGGAVADEDIELDRVRQRLAVGGGQPAADAQMVGRAVLDAVDADRMVARLDGEAFAVVDGHEIGEVGPRDGKRVGEDDADARVRRVGVDVVGDDAEAVRGDDLVVACLDRVVRLDGEARTVGAVSRLPDLAVGEAVAHEGEGGGAVGRLLGAEIGIDRRGGDVAFRLDARVVALGLARQAGGGEVEPQAGVLVGDHQRLAEVLGGFVVIAGPVGDAAGIAQRLVRAVAGIEAALEAADQGARLVEIGGRRRS